MEKRVYNVSCKPNKNISSFIQRSKLQFIVHTLINERLIFKTGYYVKKNHN